MRLSVLAAVLSVSVSFAEGAVRRVSAGGVGAPAARDRVADAYEQFLLGRHLMGGDDAEGAIAAFKRAMELDPLASDILAELAALYLQESRVEDAMAAAEQALKVAPANAEAHRVLGMVYAAFLEGGRGAAPRRRSGSQAGEHVAKAIEHLEHALAHSTSEAEPNARATLARLYVRSGSHDKAIPLLQDLVRRQPGWRDGRGLLAKAYSAAGRNGEAIEWLEEAARKDPYLYGTLAGFYDREHRWKDAADAYGKALQHAPRNFGLRTRYASALLNAGGREAISRARDVLNDVLSTRPTDGRTLYLLAQAQRRLGDSVAAESTARRVIALNGDSPWGYYALAEALEGRRQYQAVIDALSPAIGDFRANSRSNSFGLTLLLPHVGFAYQELGQYDQAIAAFDEALKLSPGVLAVRRYLIQANLSAKKYSAALELARAALKEHPNDLHFARLEAQALRESGNPDQAFTVLENVVKQRADQPMAYVTLARAYSDGDRSEQAVKVLQDAQVKFPTEPAIAFELGALFVKKKRYADAEAAFLQVLARDPDNAPALNYLGYMLAERGERLDESVGYLKKALEIEPENAAYLDSLGWAYFKENKLALAQDNLKRAADQLQTNSVVQDHYGEVLFKIGHYGEAIAAWTRALVGDGDSIDRRQIDQKIRTAKQELGKTKQEFGEK